MPSESLNYSFLEESWIITVWSFPGFTNRENKTKCYLKLAFQLLYFNVLFRQFIINIVRYILMIGQDKKSQHLAHNYQNIIIIKELQKKIGEIYSGVEFFPTDEFFILVNLRIKFQIDAGDFERLLYNMLSEEPFKNHRFDMTDENYDYTIFYYVSQYFGILIGEAWTCLTCH